MNGSDPEIACIDTGLCHAPAVNLPQQHLSGVRWTAENGTAGSSHKDARFVHNKIVQNPPLICRNTEKYRHFVQN